MQGSSEGSLLIVSRVGIGKFAIANNSVCTSQDFSSFIPYADNIIYLGNWFLQNKNLLQRYAQGTSIKGLTIDVLQTFKVQLPHPSEQQKISDFLKSIDKKIQDISERLEKTDSYKKALLQQMFV